MNGKGKDSWEGQFNVAELGYKVEQYYVSPTRNPLLASVTFHILVDAAEIVHGQTLMSQQRQGPIPYLSQVPLEPLQPLFV